MATKPRSNAILRSRRGKSVEDMSRSPSETLVAFGDGQDDHVGRGHVRLFPARSNRSENIYRRLSLPSS